MLSVAYGFDDEPLPLESLPLDDTYTFVYATTVVVLTTLLVLPELSVTLTYTVYEKYETTPEDVAYITRDVGDNIEVTLVTCTDDSNARIIVKARV